ncbi:hypothetical protein HG535_0G01420 [Zygotorulaspora mrakii]|uniref:Pre-rRNA-processing protein IPI3 n=1 Tax=Zygotorulaspora mrakii TaxID=42260 RepID=A0A7H9B6A8_ZYGMR|nr:uncharacterized protein HG535_0G01420 [Zygotorulaspora mrakii]QLG74258.1 hypothetical protein HG535_0G01420 [Zygotorulaspora mrakii]
MDEQIVFTTNDTASVANIHTYEQATLRQCTVGSKNSAVKVGNKYLFVAQGKKALINVYNIAGQHKRESIEQRLPLPEVINCLEVVESNGITYSRNEQHQHKLANFDLPYLLIGSTPSAKLYVWELSSGILLGVKPMAHYQSITKIQSIVGGKYIVTSGSDARVMIWQTMDLVSVDEPKPICILHDHTLSVTDFQVSSSSGDFLSSSGTKLFTVSEDATLRCYSLNLIGRSNKKESINPSLLATFSLPYAIQSVTLDPADRACYIGTKEGCFNLPLYYNLKDGKISNLVQSIDEGKPRIFSLVERIDEQQSIQDGEKLYAMGQLLCDKVIDVEVTKLEISMDGTLLVVGDSHGKVSIVEIYSKQILRTMEPLSTTQSLHGCVTNILITPQYVETDGQAIAETFKLGSLNNTQKIPTLQRVIYDKTKAGQLHEIWGQVGEDLDSTILPLNDFEKYMDQVKIQQTFFLQADKNSSQIKIVGEQDADVVKHSTKDPQIEELKANVQTLTEAYKELREMHEKLYQEHEALLARNHSIIDDSI